MNVTNKDLAVIDLIMGLTLLRLIPAITCLARDVGPAVLLTNRSIHHHHHHHHHISVTELFGHLLTRSGLTYLEVSSKVCHDSFCQLGNIVSLPWVIYYEAFYLHVASSLFCIPVIFPKLVLLLILLQFAYFFKNLFQCILLFFSCISSLLLLFFWRPLA